MTGSGSTLNRQYRIDTVEIALAYRLTDGYEFVALPFIRAVVILQLGTLFSPRVRPQNEPKRIIIVQRAFVRYLKVNISE